MGQKASRHRPRADTSARQTPQQLGGGDDLSSIHPGDRLVQFGRLYFRQLEGWLAIVSDDRDA
jgi:hypothetical protein